MEVLLILWYGFSSLLLGILLFIPVRKFIFALSVNRQARKLQRHLNEDEMERLRKKITIIAVIISMTFSFLYNRFLMFKFWGGVG